MDKVKYTKRQIAIDYIDGTHDVFVCSAKDDNFEWDGQSMEITYDGHNEKSVFIPSTAIKKIETYLIP